MGDAPIVRRAPNGQLLKGSRLGSGRQSALSREELKVMGEILRHHTPKALGKLTLLMEATNHVLNPETNGLIEVPDNATQLKAAMAILDRGIGKVGDRGLEEYVERQAGDVVDMSKFTDEEMKAAEVLRNAVERLARERDAGIDSPARPISVAQADGSGAQVVESPDPEREWEPDKNDIINDE